MKAGNSELSVSMTAEKISFNLYDRIWTNVSKFPVERFRGNWKNMGM